MIKKIFVLVAIISAIYSGTSNGQSYFSRSAITFQIKNMGIGTSGSIGGLLTKVRFNPDNLNTSTLEAAVDVNTINTGNDSRDEHLRGEDFFDVARYQKITLKSTAFKRKSGNNYVGTFNLTIKDKSKQIELPFTFIEKENTVEFKGTFKINRLDFGVGGSSLVLSDEVTINISCEGKKQETVQL